uniref:Uncharacterized protein n=1 Tax=Anguilla anguilla TaxID=7936 RepID=A0A0E9S6E9_ANGAN
MTTVIVVTLQHPLALHGMWSTSKSTA